MDFEMPALEKRKSEEAPQSQGRRAVRQAVAEGGSEREVLRRLVDVLTTLSLVNTAELRDLTSTVFKTYLVPSSENVAEAMAEAGRLYHDSAGAIKNKPEAERADAQEQLGPPFRVRVGSVPAQLGLHEGVGSRTRGSSETVLGEQRVEERASAVGIARPVLQSEAVQESRGQGRVDAHRVLPGPDHLPTRGSTGGSIAAAERGEEIRPRAKRPPRTRSSEAPDADAREIERLARRVEQHSQRMAELLRRGVLEPSLAYAFLMTKGGQQIPQAKSKAKVRASSRATTNEGAGAAPDTSPPRLPPERPLVVFTRGETMVPSNAGPEVRTSD